MDGIWKMGTLLAEVFFLVGVWFGEDMGESLGIDQGGMSYNIVKDGRW